MDEKRMPFINFKIENASNLKMELKKTTRNIAYLFTEI